MANMIVSYFGKGVDSHEEFDTLNVSKYPWYRKHLNRHNVIHIMFNEMPKNCKSYEQYIARFEKGLITDLQKNYPKAEIEKEDAVWDALKKVYIYCGTLRGNRRKTGIHRAYPGSWHCIQQE